jgi:arylsulfatase A-like enzyme
MVGVATNRAFRRTIRRTALLLVLSLTPTACNQRASQPPNILVIVIDTLRADRLGVYHNTRGLTPFLDTVAQRGTVFANAYAPSSWTCPSVASLMTSRYPTQHRVADFRSVLPDAELTFAEKLAPARYVSAGFSANLGTAGNRGYAQGFGFWRTDSATASKAAGGPSGKTLRRQSSEWLDENWSASSPRPALLYFQFMEPHSPYDPPEPYRSRFVRSDGASVADPYGALQRWIIRPETDLAPGVMRYFADLYDAEVAAVDNEIRLLFDELERREFLRHAIVIITADHGEELWEHGRMEHGKSLYGESVRVPLILVTPDDRGGRRVEHNVSLLDIAPTILDLVGLPPEPRFEGRSLVPLLEDGSLVSRLRAAWGGDTNGKAPDVLLQLESLGQPGADQRAHIAGIVRGPVKLVITANGSPEIFDLTADPGEHGANPPALQTEAAVLVERLQTMTTQLTRRAGAAERAPLDEAAKEKLRALGYHF